MKTVRLILLVTSSMAVATLGGCASKEVVAPQSEVIPEEAQYGLIDLACSQAGWPTLRKVAIEPGTSELRVWFDHGIVGITGFALTHGPAGSKGQEVEVVTSTKTAEVTPTSGWSEFWRRFESFDDFSSIPRLERSTYPHSFDSGNVIIEWISDGKHHYYSFGNDEADAQSNLTGVGAVRSFFKSELVSSAR